MGHCIAIWYAMSRSLEKLTETGTSWGRGATVSQKLNNTKFSNGEYDSAGIPLTQQLLNKH